AGSHSSSSGRARRSTPRARTRPRAGSAAIRCWCSPNRIATMSDSLQASILIVDDNRANLIAMQEVLSNLGTRLVAASSGEEALRKVLEEDFAAILLDVRMPGIDGFTTASMIRERKRSRYTPIIFMTAAQEDLQSM